MMTAHRRKETTMTDTLTLPYGLSEAVPADAKAAWGARFIVTQDGHVDLPHDRQGFTGDENDRLYLMGRMEAEIPMNGLRELIKDLLIQGRLNTRVDREVVLDDANGIRVVANTKASAGYLYVAAFEVPE
jgi:hypothetical protein